MTLDRAYPDAIGHLATATLAHAPEWHEAIQHAYGHRPLYLSMQDASGDRGVLPAFIVRRPWFGTIVTSMPFLDTGGPCAASLALAHTMVNRLVDAARDLGAVAVELRCTGRLDLAVPAMEHKFLLALPLPADADGLWHRLGGGVRNQIRKAQRAGLGVEVGGPEGLDDFYAVFARRMRDLGSPVHGRAFFEAVFDAFGGRARLALVRKGRTTVGGLIALANNGTLAVPWAACLHEFFTECPNMLLYWEALRHACGQRFTRFDFGRSTRGSGTYRFKRQWGAAEEPLYWYTIPLTAGRRRAPAHAASRADLLTGSWRHLPLTLTRQLGPRIRRYLTQ